MTSAAMFRGSIIAIAVTVMAFSVNSQSSYSDNVALFWNLYDSVVTGSRILHDVTEGVGAVSKAIKAIDTFLDTSAEKQLRESLAEADLLEDSETEASTPDLVLEQSCDVTSGKETTCQMGKNTRLEPDSPPPEPEMPKFNGCGALGFHIRDTNLPIAQMTNCCGVHDACYSSACRANKRDCDNKLRSCIFSVCEDKTIDRTLKKPCFAAAKLLFSGTMALSPQQYSGAQVSLKCPGKGQRYRKGR